MENTLLFNL